jgi:hypothetical protein
MANFNKEKKYHYIYKTTNLKNGKFYIGMHSTNKLDDGYLGSGYKLRRSINKHGKENFKVEYLEFFDNRVDLINSEKELVNESLLKDPMCMNLVFGGNGGYISTEGVKKGGYYSGNLLATKIKTDSEYRKKHIDRFICMVKECFRTGKLKTPNWKGKKHKEETKQKIGLTNSLKQKGENNSQFGTCWITNGIENKKIKKTDLIPDGWKNGRIVNKLK